MNTYKKITQDEKNAKFISKATNVWGYKYDYDLVEYINSTTPVLIGFNEVFYLQTPNKHLLGKKIELYNKMFTNNEFIEKSMVLWGDRFDYKYCVYMGLNEKVILYDKKKNKTIEQSAKLHLSGSEVIKFTSVDFFMLLNLIHDYKYDYSESVFGGLTADITVKCQKHGNFTLKSTSHLYGASKCPSCRKSDPETIINLFLGTQRFDYTKQHKFRGCTNNGFELPFDFYIPCRNLCIEYHTKAHITNIGTSLSDDNIKKEYCEDNYINLLVLNDINYIDAIKRYL